MISLKTNINIAQLNRAISNAKRKIANKVLNASEDAYIFASINTAYYTGFLQGNWRVTYNTESSTLYGEYYYRNNQIVRKSGDSSDKNFFNVRNFNFDPVYITNPTPYAVEYNQGGFKPVHKDLVRKTADYVLANN